MMTSRMWEFNTSLSLNGNHFVSISDPRVMRKLSHSPQCSTFTKVACSAAVSQEARLFPSLFLKLPSMRQFEIDLVVPVP
jgi:hypothetical protein